MRVVYHDTVNCFTQSGHMEMMALKPVFELGQMFLIKEPDSVFLRDIIGKRLKLARDTITDNDGRLLLNQRIEKFEDSAVDLSPIIHVGVTGLRHTVKELAGLFATLSNESFFDRFFCKSGALRTYYYTSGKKHYSQINSGITNIFLVNTRYRAATNPIRENGEPVFSERHLEDHPQTYWLKYLVLMVIKHAVTDQADIVGLFSAVGRYPKGLVELVLFSLSEVRHGRLIRPKIRMAEHGSVEYLGLETTSRADPLLEKNCFWEFDYLAMVTEDIWLEVPNFLQEKFRDPLGFAHLGVPAGPEYQAALFDFLMQKIETVSLFLNILQACLALEKSSKLELFQALDKRGVKFPEFSKVRGGCMARIHQLAAELNPAQKVAVTKLSKKRFGQLNGLLWRWKIKRKLRECYPAVSF